MYSVYNHWDKLTACIVGKTYPPEFYYWIKILDPKNIIVSAHNDKVEKACARYGIKCMWHLLDISIFWDAGTHCITNDINRRPA